MRPVKQEPPVKSAVLVIHLKLKSLLFLQVLTVDAEGHSAAEPQEAEEGIGSSPDSPTQGVPPVGRQY